MILNTLPFARITFLLRYASEDKSVILTMLPFANTKAYPVVVTTGLLFVSIRLQKQALDASENKKPCNHSCRA